MVANLIGLGKTTLGIDQNLGILDKLTSSDMSFELIELPADTKRKWLDLSFLESRTGPTISSFKSL